MQYFYGIKISCTVGDTQRIMRAAGELPRPQVELPGGDAAGSGIHKEHVPLHACRLLRVGGDAIRPSEDHAGATRQYAAKGLPSSILGGCAIRCFIGAPPFNGAARKCDQPVRMALPVLPMPGLDIGARLSPPCGLPGRSKAASLRALSVSASTKARTTFPLCIKNVWADFLK